jgi:hypothetical protein
MDVAGGWGQQLWWSTHLKFQSCHIHVTKFAKEVIEIVVKSDNINWSSDCSDW